MAVPSNLIEISSSPAVQQKPEPVSHRLATVSASQALVGLESKGSDFAATGIPSLDSILSGTGSDGDGGLARGKITEIWGPIGAGKTAIAFQSTANVLRKDHAVVWVDCATALSRPRLQSVSSRTTSGSSSSHAETNFHKLKHITVPSLSHLLAMLLHPPSDFIPPECDLLVIDGMNSLVDLDYPRYQFTTAARSEQQRWQAGRRYAVLSCLVSAVNRLAVMNSLAAIVTTGCVTRMRSDSGLGAALVPGIAGSEWDGGIWNRLVVFRDFASRFIGVQKAQGKSFISREEVGETGRIIAFDIASDGSVCERRGSDDAHVAAAKHVKTRLSPVKPRKRNIDEIADSEGEEVDEYGWAETDEDAITAEGLTNDAHTAEDTLENG